MFQFTASGNHQRNPMKQGARADSGAFTLIELVIVLFVIGLLIALLLPATRSSGRSGRRNICKNNLKQIGIALHGYHDTYDTFPPAYTVDADGKPLHSWRALILPWVEQAELYKQIDFSRPWDDPVNQAVSKQELSIYRCPAAEIPGNHTTYFALVTADSVLRPEKSLTVSEITDGLESTLMVIEADADQSQPWMAPSDADEAMWLGWNDTSKSSHTGGRQGLLADGTARFFSATIPIETRRALSTSNAGEPIPDNY